MRRMLGVVALGAALAGSGIWPAAAQDAVKMKFSHWVVASHPVSVWIQKWADDLRAKSGGKIDIEVFPNMQLGSPGDHYDMVRRGTVDMAWIMHGLTSDRFPLTTLIDIPFMADTAEHASKALNNAELRAKYLDPEARGIRTMVLFTNQPAHLHIATRPVRSPADIKGMRIRSPSATQKRFLEEIGAVPVGIPSPAMAENLQKGVLDGVLTDYGGAGIAFKLGGLVKHTSEVGSYVSSFALVINPDSYAKLKGANKELFDKSIEDSGAALGRAMDSIDGAGKKALMDAGMQVFTPGPAELAPFREAGKRVADETVAEREKAGRPARAVFDLMQKSLAEARSK